MGVNKEGRALRRSILRRDRTGKLFRRGGGAKLLLLGSLITGLWLPIVSLVLVVAWFLDRTALLVRQNNGSSRWRTLGACLPLQGRWLCYAVAASFWMLFALVLAPILKELLVPHRYF